LGGVLAHSVIGASPARRTSVQAERPVVVALVSDLPDSSARAVVVRRQLVEPREVIVLREAGATASDLGAAIALLMRSRSSDGDAFQGEFRITLQASAVIGDLPTGVNAHLVRELDRARHAHPRSIAGIGSARAVMMDLHRFRSRS
jgi:hypothetical protein